MMDEGFWDSSDGFLDRLESVMDEARLRRFETMKDAEKYLQTARDKELEWELLSLIDAPFSLHKGVKSEGRALMVIGEPGVGKSWSLRRAFDMRDELRPVEDSSPLVRFIAPSPCTLKQLGRELLTALGYPIEQDIKEHLVWERVRNKLRLRRARVIWIDDMNHAMRGTEVQKLRDTIKNVMQQPEWPVSFVLSGTPVLSGFFQGDFQFQRRKRVVYFRNLELPRHAKLVTWAIETIVERHAGMKLEDGLLTDEFLKRLCHAACNGFGTVTVVVRCAVEHALRSVTDNMVTAKHFAMAYRSMSGCESTLNVFTAERWHLIDVMQALFPDTIEPAVLKSPVGNRRRRREP